MCNDLGRSASVMDGWMDESEREAGRVLIGVGLKRMMDELVGGSRRETFTISGDQFSRC